MRESEEVRLGVQRIIALPFIPASQINRTFNVVQMGLSPAAETSLKNFLEYWNRQWNNNVTPAGISIYGLQQRTTNAIESFHLTLLRTVGTYPQIWHFIRKKISI